MSEKNKYYKKMQVISNKVIKNPILYKWDLVN